MSLYFDLVINCDLREDTPEDAIEAIRCFMTKGYEIKINPQLLYPNHGNVWEQIHYKHFLASDPQQGIMSNFRHRLRRIIPTENNREVYRYHLQYMGHFLHDDYFHHAHMPFIYWLATVSYHDYFGYYAESGHDKVMPHGLFVTKDRLLGSRKLWTLPLDNNQ
jgi:hypothetical protein